ETVANDTKMVANATELVAIEDKMDATEMVSNATKTVASATETVTSGETEKEKCHQNSGTNATKMVAPMSDEPSNDAGFERPKEILNKNINTVVEEEKDPFNLLESKYVQRRNKGLSLSPKDCESISRV